MARRRGFGEVERRASATGQVTYRARYAMPDGTRYSRTLTTKLDAEAWLMAERLLIDREEWTSPHARQAARVKRETRAARNTVAAFAEQYLTERGLRPTTVKVYRTLLTTRILPVFGAHPLSQVTLSDIKVWRASLDPATAATNAAAYRLLRSLLASAEEEELIDRAPPKIRGAGSARVRRVAKPATFAEIEAIAGAMPARLRLFVVLAAYVGLREGELLELRRSDVDGVAGGHEEGRQGRHLGRGRCLLRVRAGDLGAEDGERGAHRPRPTTVPPGPATAPARAHSRRSRRPAVPRQPDRPHEHAIPHGPLPASP